MSTDPKSAEQNEKKQDGDPNTEQADNSPGRHAAQTCPKKLSMWKKALNAFRSTYQNKDIASPPEDASSKPNATNQADSLVKLINADLTEMSKETKALTKYNTQLTNDLKGLQTIFDIIKNAKEDEKIYKLTKFRKELMKVKLDIPSKTGANKNKQEKNLLQFIEEYISEEESKKMPQLHKSPVFETSMEFKDFEARYEELEDHVKLCLLCFSIFPQGATIKKRLMLQWWVVEGFASTEEGAKAYLKELMDKGFIEAVNNNRSFSVGSCRLHPFHRSALVTLAERAKMFNFGSGGDPTQSFAGSFQACLKGAGLISYDDFMKKNSELGEDNPIKVVKARIQELEKLHLLMNVDEHILEFVDEWFGKMKNLNILYLGRWKELATHHIEVEDPKFFKELGNMKYVKFLSLQGVSNIIALDQSILELTNLEVLDLRACSNLESIPEKIQKLKKLMHLDMSECYLLAHMPKGLSELTNLKVLKGFFVPTGDSKSCKIGDLENLKHLKKLCIYTDWEHFPMEAHVTDLHKLSNLTKLTITWGIGSNKNSEKQKANPQPAPAKQKANPQPAPAKLPQQLEKLDLKCFPKEDTPSWLKLKNLQDINLKKLYIRGGKFRDLGQYQDIDDASESHKEWKVEVLRLKYLGQIEMEWRQLRGLFPKLKYLEKVSCPYLTLFPCDAKGVWINSN